MQSAASNQTPTPPGGGRRRVPRRAYDAPVGTLIHGEYVLSRAHQVGEGGMMISSSKSLSIGHQMVVSFFISSDVVVVVRATVRNVVPAQGKNPLRYGLEFLSLNFHYKREIRNFVASASELGA